MSSAETCIWTSGAISLMYRDLQEALARVAELENEVEYLKDTLDRLKDRARETDEDRKARLAYILTGREY